MQFSISDKERKLFSGRENYLKILKKPNKNTIILSQNGFGKTTILKKISLDNQYIYLDLKKTSISPENFSIEYIGTICQEILEKNPTNTQQYLDPEFLKKIDLKESKEAINIILNELEKIKPNQQLLVKTASKFPELLAKEKNRKITIIIDNFEELLALNNYSQIKTITDTFLDIINVQETKYILSSSAINLSKKVLKNHKEIEIIFLEPFSLDETSQLITKLCNKIDNRTIEKIHKLSNGIPTIIKAICQDYLKSKTKSNINYELKIIDNLFLKQILHKNSQTYPLLHSTFKDCLSKARGATLLKIILKVMSKNSRLKLSEIARLIYRSPPITKSLLERLIEVDIITKKEDTFVFTNPVLKQWCSYYFNNIEFDEEPSLIDLENISKKW